MSELQTRECGAIHPTGKVCVRTIMYEAGCCTDQLYHHKGPHQHMTPEGVITHRWKEKRVIEDVAFDGYLPLEEEE